jgi:hypothetical protein
VGCSGRTGYLRKQGIRSEFVKRRAVVKKYGGFKVIDSYREARA